MAFGLIVSCLSAQFLVAMDRESDAKEHHMFRENKEEPAVIQKTLERHQNFKNIPHCLTIFDKHFAKSILLLAALHFTLEK